MKRKIKKILDEIGLDRTLIGYGYWIDFIVFVEKQHKGKILQTINQEEYYEKYCKLNGICSKALGRNLRYTLQDHKEEIKKYFNYDGNISCKKFLLFVLEKVRKENVWRKIFKK